MQNGNDFGSVYEDLTFVAPQVIKMVLRCHDVDLTF